MKTPLIHANWETLTIFYHYAGGYHTRYFSTSASMQRFIDVISPEYVRHRGSPPDFSGGAVNQGNAINGGDPTQSGGKPFMADSLLIGPWQPSFSFALDAPFTLISG